MRTLTFTIAGAVTTTITLTELSDGTIRFDIVQSGDQPLVGDLRALFFDVANEALLSSLSVSGADVTDFRASANSVTDMGQGANVNGEVVNEFGRFDVGVEFGTSGISQNDIRTTSFILSSSSAFLTLDFLQMQDFAIRITSVGEDGGARNDSLKLGEEATAAPNAFNDAFVVSEDDTLTSANVLANDTDADAGQVLTVQAVDGDPGNVGVALSVMSAGGRSASVTITASGQVLFTPGAAFQDLGVGQTDTITVSYTVSDGNGGFDTATVTLTVTGAADGAPGPTIIGHTGVGSLAIGPGVAMVGDNLLGSGVISGSTLTSQDFVVGYLPGSTGTAVISGPSSALIVTPGAFQSSIGLAAFMGIGWANNGAAGDGSMRVENGGLVVVDSGNYVPGVGPFGGVVNIGVGAGSVGELVVTGAGSLFEMRGTGNNLVIGGLPTAVGTVLVEDGGVVHTQRLAVGLAGGTGDFVVTGIGSTLLLTTEHGTRGGANSIHAGTGIIGLNGGTGSLSVLDGGRVEQRPGATQNTTGVTPRLDVGLGAGSVGVLTVDGAGSVYSISSPNTPPTSGPGAWLHLGGNNGFGEATLTNGGAIEILGPRARLDVGGLGGGDGTLDILSGATLTMTGDGAAVWIASSIGAVGVLTVDGPGSVLSVTGGPTFQTNYVGLQGDGELNITNGGSTSIIDAWGLSVAAGPGSTGRVNISGAGSSLVTNGDVNVGESGVGSLTISDQGSFASDRMGIGINPGSSGTVTVTGAGSSLVANGEVKVGQEGNATVLVEGQASLTCGGLVLADTGFGSLTVDGAGSLLSVANTSGAVVTVGNSAGYGHIIMRNQATAEIIGPGGGLYIGQQGAGTTGVVDIQSGATLQVGGDGAEISLGADAGATGVINVDGAGSSLIVDAGAVPTDNNIGYIGAAEINVTNGASVSLLNHDSTSLGHSGGSGGGSGQLNISGPGSIFTTNSGIRAGEGGGATGTISVSNQGALVVSAGGALILGLGAGSGELTVTGAGSSAAIDGHLAIGHTGDGHLTVLDDGLVRATLATVGDQGSISGNGTIQADVTVNGAIASGVVNPGASTGVLTIDGAFTITNGTLNIEVGGTTPGATSGGYDVLNVTGAAGLNGGFLVFSFVDGFAPMGGDSFAFLTGGSVSGDANYLSIVVEGLAAGFSFDPLVFGPSSASITASVVGVAEANTTLLFGSDRADVFDAGAGNDVLSGGLGADTLTGGAGNDAFVFDSDLGGGNVDQIVDYVVGEDAIHLDVTRFGIASGALDAGAFHIGAVATSAAHRIVYDDATGSLYFDEDGDGAGAAILFATLTSGLTLTNADFIGVG